MNRSDDPVNANLAGLLPGVCQVARDAGDIIMRIYAREFDVAEKEDRSPVTAADLAANRHIEMALQALTPGWPVLSEESGIPDYSVRRTWRYYWLVDPLDGTREFIKRNGEFTVNIALIHTHRPVLGVVDAPAQRRQYFGATGCGAFRTVADGAPVRVSVRSGGNGPPRILASRSHRGDSLVRFLQRVGEHRLLIMGSSLKLCLLAEGAADLYPRLGPTSEWDIAAGDAVLRAAGGSIVTIDGRRLRYNTGSALLNPHFLALGASDRDWLAHLD